MPLGEIDARHDRSVRIEGGGPHPTNWGLDDSTDIEGERYGSLDGGSGITKAVRMERRD